MQWRERRIPLGSESESENPIFFFVPFVLETAGVEVTIKPDITNDDVLYYQHELEPLVKLRAKLEAQRA